MHFLPGSPLRTTCTSRSALPVLIGFHYAYLLILLSHVRMRRYAERDRLTGIIAILFRHALGFFFSNPFQQNPGRHV